MPREKLSPEEQLARKDETCQQFVDEIKKRLLEDLTLIIERSYWTAWGEGYQYRNAELAVEKKEAGAVP